MEQPLLSIVIPTRNRELYCKEAIRHILSFDDTNFELVIYDNSDSNELRTVSETIGDKRLKYFKIDGRENFVILFDKAISCALGDYVILIGDDDSVLPNIVSVAKWAKDNRIPAVTPKLSYGFLWNLDGGKGGKLICHGSYDKSTTLNAKKQLRLLLRNGIIQYSDFDLPKVYHGLMSREVLQLIKKKTGHYVGGLSPDIYLSVASCLWIDEYVKIDFPFSIPGACKKSASVGNPRGKYEEMPHLWHRGEYSWNDLIPRYNSAQTIWAETALNAISENDENGEFAGLFDRKYFLTAFRLQNLDRKSEIDQYIKNEKYIYVQSFLRFYYNTVLKKLGAVANLIRGERKVYNIKNSWDDVVNAINKGVIYW